MPEQNFIKTNNGQVHIREDYFKYSWNCIIYFIGFVK